MKKGILALALVMVMILPTIAAAEWDNIGRYNERTKTMEVVNLLGFGSTIANITLITPQHNKIIPNGQPAFEIEVTVFTRNYTNAIGTLNFFQNSKLGASISSPQYVVQYYNPRTWQEDVPTFNEVCSKSLNVTGGYSCSLSQNGTVRETRTGRWIDYSTNDIPLGTTRLRYWYKGLKEGETIEWIPRLFGVEIEEWADFSGYARGERYTINEDANNGVRGNRAVGQIFTHGLTSGTNTNDTVAGFSIKADLGSTVALGREFDISIYPSNATFGHLPSGRIAHARINTSTEGLVVGTPKWINVSFTTTGTLVNGTQYGLYINSTDNLGVNDDLDWSNDETSGTYAGGDMVITTAYNKDDWVTSGVKDMMFEIWVEQPMTVTLNAPADALSQASNNIVLNGTATEPTGVLSNATVFVYDTNSNALQYSNNITIDGTTNETIWNITLPGGSHTWDIEFCGTGSLTCATGGNRTFITGIVNNAEVHNDTTYETAPENFFLNVTLDPAYTSPSANLWYNGTSYASTRTAQGADQTFSYTLQVPTLATANGQDNTTITWQVALNSTDNYNISAGSQMRYPINITECNGTDSDFLNVTFIDSETSAFVDATFENSWTYYLGDGTQTRSNTFDSNVHNTFYHFCFEPNNRVVTISGNSVYQNTSYPQREHNFGGTYDTNTTNQTLYLLSSSDGIYTTLQILGQSGQALNNVAVTVERQFSGTWTQIDAGTTGTDGGVTFWVNSDYQHRFTLSRTGYTTQVETFTPTQSTYTIYMGGNSSATTIDWDRGIWYVTAPEDEELQQNTYYNFNFTITSTYWALEEYGIVLEDEDKNPITSASGTTATGGVVSVNVSTALNDSMHMSYYWVINGNYSNASSINWFIGVTDEGFGLNQFFTHLVTYTDADGELFGMGPWERGLLIFLFIFIVVGTVGYMFGFNPFALGILTFALVFLFDVVLKVLPTAADGPLQNSNGLATIAMGLILAILWLRESMR